MKIEVKDSEQFIVYYFLILDDILNYDVEDIKMFIKLLVLKLRKRKFLDIKGYYHVDVHINKIMILEFKKIDDYEDEIDLNIKIFLETPILVEFEDYFLIPRKKVEYQGKYYLKIEEVEYEKYIEFTRIVYKEEAKKILLEGKTV